MRVLQAECWPDSRLWGPGTQQMPTSNWLNIAYIPGARPLGECMELHLGWDL